MPPKTSPSAAARKVTQRKPRGEGYLRRDEILTAARALFLAEGVERVTIRAICKRVGLTAPALYRHFRDKREIIIAICNETTLRLLHSFRAIRLREPDPLAALRQMLEAYIRFALAHRDEYRLLFMTANNLFDDFSEDFRCDEDALKAGIIGPLVHRELVEHVALCIERGILMQGDPEIMTEALWAAGHGLASLLITNPHFKWRPHEEIIKVTLEMPLSGLLRR